MLPPPPPPTFPFCSHQAASSEVIPPLSPLQCSPWLCTWCCVCGVQMPGRAVDGASRRGLFPPGPSSSPYAHARVSGDGSSELDEYHDSYGSGSTAAAAGVYGAGEDDADDPTILTFDPLGDMCRCMAGTHAHGQCGSSGVAGAAAPHCCALAGERPGGLPRAPVHMRGGGGAASGEWGL